MAKVVDLKSYRIRSLEKKAFGPWQARFAESYDSRTRLGDVSDKTLYYLSQPGEKSAAAYYELIMGILDLGQADGFYFLGNREQMQVVDIHLLLADQVRLELMRRLEWIQSFEGERYSLLEMVREFDKIKEKCRRYPPHMAPSDINYAEYIQLTDGDKEVFIRRMLSQALDAFKKRI